MKNVDHWIDRFFEIQEALYDALLEIRELKTENEAKDKLIKELAEYKYMYEGLSK